MDHLIFHPGGKKNSANSRSIVFGFGQNIDDTKEVLRLYGNMSSATVLYVLERFMDNRRRKKLNVKFWPWIFSTTCFIAVLINKYFTPDSQIFYVEKALDL
jgi:3-oxoacyl-[acyl-carrier-protein] synthase III